MQRSLAALLVAIGFLTAIQPSAAAINPLPLIAQYESGGNPTAQNPKTTSSGLYGFLNSTWQTDLAAIGGNPAQYPSAKLAPASLQTAVAAYAVDTNGLNDWLCAGCDLPFANAVETDGGVGAFQTAGLSTDPATYGALDTGTSLAGLLGGGGGGGGDTLTLADTGGGGAPPAGVPSPSSLPFEWVYAQVIDGIMGAVDTSIGTVEAMLSGPANTILALAIAIMGMMTLFGNMDMAVFISFAIRAAIVMAFIQEGNTFYADWVEAFVLGLPDFFSHAFAVTVNDASPAALFDGILNGWWASSLAVWHSSGWSAHALFVGAAIVFLTVLIVVPALVAMFTVFLISTFLLLVMLTIGPLMILGLLFRTTQRFLHGYVNVLVTAAIFALVVDIVLGIFSSILSQIMAQFTPSGAPDTDVTGLFGLAITMLITGFTMARLPRLVEAIGGGVAVSMDTAGRYVAGGLAADAGVAGARLATRTI